jgi:ectoine hydroxylase-related dioxygenase (phytanoyl-CoA dioxygenase family)
MRTEAERYLFDLDGYIVVRQALTPTEVGALNNAVDRLPPETRGDRSSHAHSGFVASAANGTSRANDTASREGGLGMLDWGPEFRALVGHRRLVPYLAALLGDNFRLDHHYAVFQRDLGAAGVPNPLHNGAVPFDPSSYYLVREGRIYNGMIVVSIAITDAPADAGGFCCIPGSHKSNFPLPAALRDLEGARSIIRQVPLQAGDALLFTEALTHGALAWRGATERRALLFKYCSGHIQWDSVIMPTGSHKWTPEQRRILRPPFVRDREPSAAGQVAMVRHRLYGIAAGLRNEVRRRTGGRVIDHA